MADKASTAASGVAAVQGASACNSYAVRQPRRRRSSTTRSGESTAMQRSRNKSDTVDLLQGGSSGGDLRHGGLAQEAKPALARGLLQTRDRLPVDDHLAQLV